MINNKRINVSASSSWFSECLELISVLYKSKQLIVEFSVVLFCAVHICDLNFL